MNMVVFFNVILFAITIIASVIVYRRRETLRSVNALIGAMLILAGVWIRAFYSLADLVTLLAPDLLGDETEQERIIESLHSTFEWPTNSLFVLLVVLGLSILVRRVSEQVQKEKDLARSRNLHQERLNQAAEIAKLGYYLYNPRTEKIEFCTDVHAENHGLPRAEYMEKVSTLSNDMPLIHPDDREMLREKYRDVQAGTTIDVEYRVPTQDGTKRIREITQPVFDDGGDIVFEMGTSQDITEQYNLEQRLIQSQKLEAVGQLTGGVAHDFNNLLAVILGNLELLREGVDNPEQIENCEAAISAALSGAALTRNMLSFARRARLVPELIDINDTVRSLELWARRTLPATIEPEVSLQAGLWRSNLDKGLLESALLNLIVNARDAMPEGGKLTIETANVRIDEDYIETRVEDVEPGRYVMLAVSDTGHGIPKEELDRVFDPFFTTKGVGEGTGLGLSMVQGFVKQSRGAIRVYSETETGTTFKLYFRADSGPKPSAGVRKDAGEVRRATAGARILLSEDELEVQRIVAKHLRDAGYVVHATNSGDEARAAFDVDQSYDLLLTDIVMPGSLQGTLLAKELRAIKPDLPVVFMSGYPNEAAVHGNGLRPDDIRLMKPVRKTDLLDAVHKALTPAQPRDRP